MIDPEFNGFDHGNDDFTVMPLDIDGDGQAEGFVQYSGMDQNGNPTTELAGIDTDGDGVIDTWQAVSDSDGDGYMETFVRAADYDRDGVPDNIQTYVDTDMDGNAEVHVNTHNDMSGGSRTHYTDIYVDTDGDGQAEMSARQEFIDTDGDGRPDVEHVWENNQGADPTAGEDQGELPYDPARDMAVAQDVLNLPPYDTAGPASGAAALGAQYDPSQSDPDCVAGDPEAAMEHWECQGATQRCALFSQKFVIEELTGREIDIEEIVAVAEANGWFVDDGKGGTAALNMDKILEYYGVESRMYFDSDIDTMEEALRRGDKVIVAIQADQVWRGEDNNIFSPACTADHAVEVIAIDRTDPAHPMVVLNDSGIPDGRGEMVPLEVFENAWSTSDHQMVVATA